MIEDFKQPPARKPIRLDTMNHVSGDDTQLTEARTTPTPSNDSDQLPQNMVSSRASSSIGSAALTDTDTDTVSKADFEPVSVEPEETEVVAPAPLHALPAHSSPPVLFKLFGRFPITRKRLIIAAAILVAIIGGGSALALTRHPSKSTTPALKVATIAPKAVVAPITSPLTGISVTKEQQLLPVTGVMIENSPDARPQSGLKDAGVVYEAIAEAGITRFLALYQEAVPGNVGPIRSARPYYLRWLLPYNASLAHVGGSPDALADIKSLGVRDLDQFANGTTYHRISTRYAPHNVYTGIDSLQSLEKAKGYDTSTFAGFARKSDKPYAAPAPAPTASTKTTAAAQKSASDSRVPAHTIDFSISGGFYDAHFDYDPSSNSYKRSEGGAAHIDFETKDQLSPKVVIALAMPYSLMSDGLHSVYNTIGSGNLYVFQDGTVTDGTWTKADDKTQFSFIGKDGKPITLNAGQTWITAISDISKATYAP